MNMHIRNEYIFSYLYVEKMWILKLNIIKIMNLILFLKNFSIHKTIVLEN